MAIYELGALPSHNSSLLLTGLAAQAYAELKGYSEVILGGIKRVEERVLEYQVRLVCLPFSDIFI